jgi:hypothetical protein
MNRKKTGKTRKALSASDLAKVSGGAPDGIAIISPTRLPIS